MLGKGMASAFATSSKTFSALPAQDPCFSRLSAILRLSKHSISGRSYLRALALISMQGYGGVIDAGKEQITSGKR
jgi:hypothetical protein